MLASTRNNLVKSIIRQIIYDAKQKNKVSINISSLRLDNLLNYSIDSYEIIEIMKSVVTKKGSTHSGVGKKFPTPVLFWNFQ